MTERTRRLVRERLELPADRPVERLDVRELGPPKPLSETLETLADLDDETVVGWGTPRPSPDQVSRGLSLVPSPSAVARSR
jgi:hypothetical protein